MANKSFLIIGAGIAGLSAGCYARMNGYDVEILEQDSGPGGLCTAWERKGYTIHGNMAFLGGSGPGVGFHRLWRELGVVPALEMIDYDDFIIVEGMDGGKFRVHTDIDKLETHMLELAPEDKDHIRDFIGGMRVFTRYDLALDKAPELMGLADKVKLVLTKLPLLMTMAKWKKITLGDFACGFRNPLMRESFNAFTLIFTEDLPVVLIQAFLAWSHKKACGYPLGGALPFIRAIEKRFLGLGGKIRYGTKVGKIIVDNGRAVGVRTEDGQEFTADYVVSAADGRRTIFDWLEGKYTDPEIEDIYKLRPVSSSSLLVALGAARTFEDLPSSGAGWIYFLDEPVTLGGKEFRSIRPMIYNFDPSLAPPGKTLIRLLFPADWDFWNALREAPDRYRAEKEKIAGTVISLLDRRYPGLAAQIEMWDVATPLTFERYTGNWKGSSIGWDLTTETFLTPMKKVLPGLDNFFMAGHWVEPGGGIPGVAASGRNVIQIIAKKDKKTFITTDQ